MARINTTRPALLSARTRFGGLWIECRLSGVLSRTSFLEIATLGSLLAVILITYLIGVGIIGVGIVLLPTIRSARASAMSTSIGQKMPYALAWPGEARSGRLDRQRSYRSRP